MSDDSWGRSDALVVCRQLGFHSNGKKFGTKAAHQKFFVLQLLKHFLMHVSGKVLDRFIWTMFSALVEKLNYKTVLTHKMLARTTIMRMLA